MDQWYTFDEHEGGEGSQEFGLEGEPYPEMLGLEESQIIPSGGMQVSHLALRKTAPGWHRICLTVWKAQLVVVYWVECAFVWVGRGEGANGFVGRNLSGQIDGARDLQGRCSHGSLRKA